MQESAHGQSATNSRPLTNPAARPRWFGVLLNALLLLHVVQLARYIGSWDRLTNHEPIVQVDHALHLYHGSLGSMFFRDHAANWGYDPAFMSGYPKTPYHDPSAGLADLFSLLAGGGYQPRAYKLGFYFTILTAPLAFAVGVWLLTKQPRMTLIALALYLATYWGDFPKTLIDSGLFGFVWVSSLQILVLGLAWRWHAEPALPIWFALLGMITLCLFAHPTALILLFTLLLPHYLLTCRWHGWRWHLSTWLIIALAVLANWFWLAGLFEFREYVRDQYRFMSGLKEDTYFSLSFLFSKPKLFFLLALSAIGIFGLLTASHHRPHRLGLVSLVLSTLMVAGITFFGNFSEVTRGIEHIRFQVPLLICLCVLAGGVVDSIGDQLMRGQWLRAIAQLVPLAVLILTLESYTGRSLLSISRQELHRHPLPIQILAQLQVGPAPLGYTVQMLREVRPIAIGLKPECQELVNWIKQNTTNQHRILLEDQLRLLSATQEESTHWTPLLPILTGRSFVGGQYHCTPLAYHDASLGDFALNRRPITELTSNVIMSFIRLHNVRWVISWSPESTGMFESCPELEKLGTLKRLSAPPRPNHRREDTYTFFRVKEPTSFALIGRADVDSPAPNRLVLSNLQPSDGKIVLSMHWFKRLSISPTVSDDTNRAVSIRPIGISELNDLIGKQSRNAVEPASGKQTLRTPIQGVFDDVGFICLELNKPISNLTLTCK